jgi:hypothetical protein
LPRGRPHPKFEGKNGLAERANVGLSTVKDFEAGKRTPTAKNLSAMHVVLTAEGIRMDFQKDGKPKGITIKSD